MRDGVFTLLPQLWTPSLADRTTAIINVNLGSILASEIEGIEGGYVQECDAIKSKGDERWD